MPVYYQQEMDDTQNNQNSQNIQHNQRMPIIHTRVEYEPGPTISLSGFVTPPRLIFPFVYSSSTEDENKDSIIDEPIR